MEVVESADRCRGLLEVARAAGRVVGLVPTMGALHAGHRSLMAQARRECDVVAVSIFVNPLQFGDPDDIAHYPRSLERDLLACAEAGVDVVFVPAVTEMFPTWPERPATVVSVRGAADVWEGVSRPGHFDGVATVVAKLFSVAGPCLAYFGQKDFQQLAVVRRMVADLCLPVEVVGCPTVREGDGVALSSRNARLSAAERGAAAVLPAALAAGRAVMAAGAWTGEDVAAAMREVVAAEPLAELDYAAAVDAVTLEELVGAIECSSRPGAVRLLVAARVGPVRLIDNCSVSPEDDSLQVAEATEPARQLERTG